MSQKPIAHYFLCYRSPKEAAKRIWISRKLSALGGVRLHYSFWKLPKSSLHYALELVRDNEPIVLKRSRELVHPRVDKGRRLYELGSLMAIAYNSSSASARKRAAIVRALRRTPCIPMGPSFYLFPHLKAPKYTYFRDKIMLPDDFFDFLKKLSIPAHRLTYLRIIYPQSHEVLFKRLITRQTRECAKLVQQSQGLVKRIQEMKVSWRNVRKALSEFKTRYRTHKGIAYFLYQVYGIDLRTNLKEAYSAIVSCKRMFFEKIASS
ncbi:hypothetical protein KEJ26_06905 [Candidatus Bathyarchaeota archaeon]|nr:hypothetical protein [Candidatus Bathyarchaeota archaeon]